MQYFFANKNDCDITRSLSLEVDLATTKKPNFS